MLTNNCVYKWLKFLFKFTLKRLYWTKSLLSGFNCSTVTQFQTFYSRDLPSQKKRKNATKDRDCLVAKKWIVMQSGVSLHYDEWIKYACSLVFLSNTGVFHRLHIGIIRGVRRAAADLSDYELWVLDYFQGNGYLVFSGKVGFVGKCACAETITVHLHLCIKLHFISLYDLGLNSWALTLVVLYKHAPRNHI